MRKRRRTDWDPVRDWDGLVTAPNHQLITPEQMSENARRNLLAMNYHPAVAPWIAKEDKEAMATPVGGRQYHYQG